MQGQQINLKWKSFHSNVISSFESMWEEEGLVDVTLASDGKCLKAHKIMLSASSPFFKKIFQMNPCQHPVIVLQDVHFSELESLLKFVYKGEVSILQENLPLLLRAAETLQIRGLCRHLANEPGPEEEVVNSGHKNTGNPDNYNPSTEKIPIASPKSSKKIKFSHSHNSDFSQPILPTSELSIPVYPVTINEIKCEPRMDTPAILDNKSDDDPIISANLTNPRLTDSEDDEPANASECAFDLDQGSVNFPFPPFPCPFCDRAYTRWGFRRRHIKACHTMSQSLPCKWCLEVLPTHVDWESHVCLKHSLSKSDARNGLLILEEAEVVLQIPQPTRLDALVTMIKEQNKVNEDSLDLQNEENLETVETEEKQKSWSGAR